jgi:hypothetical protein
MDFMAVTGCIEIVSAGMDEDRQGQTMVIVFSRAGQGNHIYCAAADSGRLVLSLKQNKGLSSFTSPHQDCTSIRQRGQITTEDD